MNKQLPCTDQQIRDLVSKFPTPFHLYDEKGILATCQKLNQAFNWNKGFRNYFAVKALPNPKILELVMHSGMGLDCSSLTELMLAERVGAKNQDIMFSF